MIRGGVVLRTEAVVPGYLKRYSMQINMPVQESLFEPVLESVRMQLKTVPAIDADRYISRETSQSTTLSAVIAECFGKIV